MEIILSILIPLVTSFSGYFFLSFSLFFSSLPIGLTFVFSIFWGLLFIILPLVILGLVLPYGFAFFAKIIFLFSLFFAVMGIYRFIRLRGKSLFWSFQNLSFNYTHFLIFLLFIIFFSIFTLRPVVDSDVVDSYLTLARSIIAYDHIPTHNYYDNRPFIIPPVGGPVFFAFYYALSSNLESEVFRFINLPFFFGFLVICFYIFRNYFSWKLSFLGLLILLTIPLLEDLIFQAALYPDFVFAFLSALIFFLISKIITWRKANVPLSLYTVLGFALGLSFLFKYQAIFLYGIVFTLFFNFHFQGIKKIFALLPAYFPFFLGFIIEGDLSPFQEAEEINFYFYFFCLTLAIILLLKEKFVSKGKLRYCFLGFFISLFGFIFIIRNFFVFGGVREKKESFLWATFEENKIGVSQEGGNFLDPWAIFLAPSLSLFWLLPKIVGINFAFKEEKFRLPIFFLIVWYCYWVLLLGAVDQRWLLPILPYLSIIILFGIFKLFKTYQERQKIIWSGVLFWILSSKFIFWNLSIIHLGQTTTREITSFFEKKNRILNLFSSHSQNFLSPVIGSYFFPLLENFKQYLVKISFLLTARLPQNTQDISLILFLGVSFFIVLILIKKLFSPLKLKIFLPFLIILPYVYVFWKISEGNILNFSFYEQKKLFNYWGQSAYLVPYLKMRARKDDKIVIFSIPTGLSYYTGLRVYNLQYGGGLSFFYPIYPETNQEKIYQFFKEQNIRFVAILEYGNSLMRFENLKKRTKIFEILNEEKFAKERIKPEGNNYWRVYEIM